ncbi:hypothetical protein Y032_0015g2626 [Ancylostoma ceylanicum]|uniref:Uncharacterized protein n=1 Tax=Ancylostoma ceylanicum TaxID=53326 RepID=A0A016V9I1_9BILA|nr:hypothetical protein Y032_0015g2626 [Ancylostoma ceylanicum]
MVQGLSTSPQTLPGVSFFSGRFKNAYDVEAKARFVRADTTCPTSMRTVTKLDLVHQGRLHRIDGRRRIAKSTSAHLASIATMTAIQAIV